MAVVCEAGEYCWVKGFWLAWFVVMGRFPFDRAAGCWMAGFVGGRALGRHGLHVVHVAVVCETGECCWVKGFRLTWFVVMGRFPFDRAAGCWMAWFVGGRALGRHGLHVAVVC